MRWADFVAGAGVVLTIFLILVAFSGVADAATVNIPGCATLNASNYYVLTADISNRATNCFVIDGASVTLDLNGHTVDGDNSATPAAVYCTNASAHNVVITNGSIQQFNYAVQVTPGQDNWVLSNLNISQIITLPVYFYSATYGLSSGNVLITNANISSNDLQAVSIAAETNLSISDSTLDCLSNTTGVGVAINSKRAIPTTINVYFSNLNISNCNTSIQQYTNNNTISVIDGGGTTTTKNISTTEFKRTIDSLTFHLGSTTFVQGFNFANSNWLFWFNPSTTQDLNVTLVFRNNTGYTNNTAKGRWDLSTANYTTYLEDYIRLNFTLSGGTAQASNYRLNNTLNGQIVNETAAANGFGSWLLVNDTKLDSTKNTSYNPYTMNAHPATAGYNMNASIISFTTTGTWNITFYSQAGGSAPTLCNSTACSVLGTLYVGNSALNASGACTGTTPLNGTFTVYRNSTFYISCLVQNWVSGQTNYSTCGVPASAIKKSDTWRVGLNCSDITGTSIQVNSTGATVNNTAPTTASVSISPAVPSVTDTLTCTTNGYSDADGDPQGQRFVSWYRNWQKIEVVPDATTVFYMKFDDMQGDKAYDEKNAYNGTLVGFPDDSTLIGNAPNQAGKWLFDNTCKSAGCLNFTDNLRYVNLSNSAGLNLDTFTIQGWVYFNGITAKHVLVQMLFAKDNNLNDQRKWNVKYRPDLEQFRFAIFNGTSTSNYDELYISYPNSSIVGNKFFVSAGFDNATGNLTFYVYNTTGLIGWNSSTKTITAINPSSAADLTIGAYSSVTGFNGSIDDVRFYNTMRTVAQVDADWQGVNTTTLDLTKITVHAGDFFNCSETTQDSGYSPLNSTNQMSAAKAVGIKSNYWAKGVTHQHSFPNTDAVLYTLRQYGYDWVAITNHNIASDSTGAWDVWDEWQNVAGAFIGLRSQETSQNTAHIVSLNITANQTGTAQATINSVISGAGVAIVPHPDWANVETFDNYTAMEVFNYWGYYFYTIGTYGFGNNYEGNIKNMSVQDPSKVRGIVASDDAHSIAQVGFGYVKVWVSGQETNTSIINGLLSKKFYSVFGNSTSGADLDMDSEPFTLNGYDMGSSQTNNTIVIRVTLNASENLDVIKLYFANTTDQYTLLTNSSFGNKTAYYRYTNTTPLSNGSYRIWANTTPNNYQIWSNPIYMGLSGSGNTAPNVTITAPTEATTLTNQTWDISFTATDDFNTTTFCSLFSNQTGIFALESSNASTGNLTATVLSMTLQARYNGAFQAYVNCTDFDSPNMTGQSATMNYTRVATAPTVSAVSLRQGDGSCTALPSPVVIGYTFGCLATGADNQSATTNLTYILFRNGTAVDTINVASAPNNSAVCMTPITVWNSTKSDTWLCEAYSFDGEFNSTFVNSSSITVNNTAPTTTAPSISSNEAGAYSTSVLTCANGTYSDADGDIMGIGYWRWFLNGTVLGFTNQTVYPAQVGYNVSDVLICEHMTEDSLGGVSGIGYVSNSTRVNSSGATITTPGGGGGGGGGGIGGCYDGTAIGSCSIINLGQECTFAGLIDEPGCSLNGTVCGDGICAIGEICEQDCNQSVLNVVIRLVREELTRIREIFNVKYTLISFLALALLVATIYEWQRDNDSALIFAFGLIMTVAIGSAYILP